MIAKRIARQIVTAEALIDGLEGLLIEAEKIGRLRITGRIHLAVTAAQEAARLLRAAHEAA